MTARLAQLGSQLGKMATASDIHVYTAQTPNGIKISMLLEELGLTYKASCSCLESLVTGGDLTAHLDHRNHDQQEYTEGTHGGMASTTARMCRLVAKSVTIGALVPRDQPQWTYSGLDGHLHGRQADPLVREWFHHAVPC